MLKFTIVQASREQYRPELSGRNIRTDATWQRKCIQGANAMKKRIRTAKEKQIDTLNYTGAIASYKPTKTASEIFKRKPYAKEGNNERAEPK